MFEVSFVNACLSGEILLDAIDDYIEYWHTHETGVSIETFLGMTEYEYTQWLLSGEDIILNDILAAREENIPYEQYKSMGYEQRIAARSFDADIVEELKSKGKKE